MTKKLIMMAPVIAILLAGVISTTTTTAQASIFGNFGQGYDDGKQARKQSFGSSTDALCPKDFGNNISYCAGYHAGFDEEQAALQAAQ
jgi:hypothetical protein